MKKIIALIALTIAVSSIASAQETATATISGTVITPISVLGAGNMKFGNISVSSIGGTVVLAPEGGRTESTGVTLTDTEGSVAAASFTVTGEASYTYSITLPSTLELTNIETGGEKMVVNAFKSTPTKSSGGTLDNGGRQTVFVGATLNVKGSQAIGTYKNDNGFSVTVNYN